MSAARSGAPRGGWKPEPERAVPAFVARALADESRNKAEENTLEHALAMIARYAKKERTRAVLHDTFDREYMNAFSDGWTAFIKVPRRHREFVAVGLEAAGYTVDRGWFSWSVSW